MSLLKDIVVKGIYYNTIGIKDYLLWSKIMLDDFGPEIEPLIKDIRKWSVVIPASTNDGNVLKINCWEFMGCGLQPNRTLLHGVESRICPASSVKRLDGIHGGKNAGRACWVVSHTMCSGKIQGTYDQKYKTCMICDFYRYVMEEEDAHFMSLNMLKEML